VKAWYQRGNQRRFHRVDMPVRLMILPDKRPVGKVLFHWGINYFPPSVEVQIRSCRQLLKTQISLIQENCEIVQTLFSEMMAQIEFLGELIQDISEGEHPLLKKENLQKFQSHLQGFSLLVTIQQSSPKAYQLFKLIETKNLKILQAVRYFLQNSSSSQVKIYELTDFKIDVAIEPYRALKYETIPLAHAAVLLTDFQNLYFQAWQEMMQDLQCQASPKTWPEYLVNVSTGGIAVLLPKSFPKFAHVCTRLYFPKIGVLEVKGSVVMQKSVPSEGKERIAVNFDMPTQELQISLRTQMELFELKPAVEVFG